MFKRFFSKYVRPHSLDPDRANRELVLNTLLIGLIILTFVTAFNSVLSLTLKHEGYLIWRVVLIFIILTSFIFLFWLVRKKARFVFVSYLITSLFFLFAGTIVIEWGLQNPVGSLLFALTIIMAGILLDAKHSLYIIFIAGIFLTTLLILDTKRILRPNLEWTQKHLSLGDLFTFLTLFGVIALVSWLFNTQMEKSLIRARNSELRLRRQRDKLEQIVEERTRELQTAQLQRIQHFYKFAELGHLSTAFFHDLASFSTSLGLDVEALSNDQQSEMINRIQQNIRYINDVVRRVNAHLRSSEKVQTINVQEQAHEIFSVANYTARKREVELVINVSNQPMKYKIDITRFRQLLMNLISNAMEAYDANHVYVNRQVIVNIYKQNKALIIEVTDFGKGINKNKLSKVFNAFYTDKVEGTGIGLFIVHKIAVKELGGEVRVTSEKGQTTFRVVLPY